MADLLSVAVHLPSTLSSNKSPGIPGSDSTKLLRSTSSENDSVPQPFGISCGKKVVDLEFVDLSYSIPRGLGNRK